MTDTLIHHTDLGSQYTADAYLALLAVYDIHVSMSGKGEPYDNSMIESCFSTLRAGPIRLYRSILQSPTAAFLTMVIAVHWNTKPTIFPDVSLTHSVSISNRGKSSGTLSHNKKIGGSQ